MNGPKRETFFVGVRHLGEGGRGKNKVGDKGNARIITLYTAKKRRSQSRSLKKRLMRF